VLQGVQKVFSWVRQVVQKDFHGVFAVACGDGQLWISGQWFCRGVSKSVRSDVVFEMTQNCGNSFLLPERVDGIIQIHIPPIQIFPKSMDPKTGNGVIP
jgi:hypothetical protein